MKQIWRLTAFVVSVAALALLAAVAASAAGNPHPTYTCTKVKQNGNLDVRVNVPETAVPGHVNAGFSCVANATDEGPVGDDGPAGDDGPGDDEDSTGDEGPATEEPGSDDAGEESSGATASAVVDVPQESRSLYCATSPVERANGDGTGVALNLTDSAGQLLVEMGLATHAIFYEGVGVSCDVLPGYEYAGVWVDNVGSVVPGVAVYPLFIEG